MDPVEGICNGCWGHLNKDILERIGRELPLVDLLAARAVCSHWRMHVAAGVSHLPHPHMQPQPHHPHASCLLELDAQPPQRGAVWSAALEGVAACLPRLSEVMGGCSASAPWGPVSRCPVCARSGDVASACLFCTSCKLAVYASSRVPTDSLGAQLRSLPARLPGLTKLELRFILPASAPCLGTCLQQLQPALADLTRLRTLYLIMGASPEPPELSAVLPRLPALRDLKLLSGLPQYGLSDAKLSALAAATQLQRLQVELSGLGQASDAGLAALARLTALRQLALDGAVALGPGLRGALAAMPELRELVLELNSPHHLPDLFALPALEHLELAYVGDEQDDEEEGADGGDGDAYANANANQQHPHADVPAAAGRGGRGGGDSGGADWGALQALVRCNGRGRGVLKDLRLLRCSFPADPLPLLSALTSLVGLSLHDCRWRSVWAAAATSAASANGTPTASTESGNLRHNPATQAAAPAALPTSASLALQPGSWGALTSLTRLQSFSLSQCVTPPLSEPALASLAAAWPGLTCLTLQSTQHPAAPSPLPPHCRLAALLPRWRRLEALSLSGSWCNDPRVSLDVCCLPASLTSLTLSSMTLVSGPAAAHWRDPGVSTAAGQASNAEADGGRPALPALEHLALAEVRLGRGLCLAPLLAAAPHLRSLELSNLVPNLTDDGLHCLAALTALTALHVSQDQEQDGEPEPAAPPGGGCKAAAGPGTGLTSMGLTALTGLRSLRQLEWLPWGCGPLGLEHVEALRRLRRLQLVTLRGARDGAVAAEALRAWREALPLCDIDDTEWSGLVDV